MFSVALFYLLAVICSARRTHALPLYPDTNSETQADFIQKLVAEVEDGEETAQGEQRELNNLYPLLIQHNGGRDSSNKVHCRSAHSIITGVIVFQVDDLKEVVLKLAAADKLRSQGFLRSEQNLPKTNKRACFWKYCVTN
uniref:Urotensin-related peptide 1 n=1 Tax=Myripristis murdjan TaxID=586833 RepID=A0A667Z044_9TELE